VESRKTNSAVEDRFKVVPFEEFCEIAHVGHSRGYEFLNSGDTISPTSNFLFFVADNSTTSGAKVLLHSLTVTPNDVPEPTSLALFGTAILAAGLIHRRRRKRDGMAETAVA